MVLSTEIYRTPMKVTRAEFVPQNVLEVRDKDSLLRDGMDWSYSHLCPSHLDLEWLPGCHWVLERQKWNM